ncbi:MULTISPECIES: tetratricopeptide repeat protein [Meridianimarinicoccus]|uniref:tetratricopeptide repeat protein n=1 Tax=Meridianimarinicoccus zhengii TaxID=2056810 RepID=UPI0013A6DD40|nr:tetratricopeptide repeat protein [Phycocomes zhengii]
MSNVRLTLAAITVGMTLLLAGCDTVEERAEAKYQSAIELADAGEIDRAKVELRAVFDLDGEHRDARMLYADLLREGGEFEEAFRHYLLVAEQNPDDFDSRLAMSELAISMGAWDLAKRHSDAAAALRPGDPALETVLVVVAYADASRQENAAERDAAAETALELTADDPGNILAQQVAIDALIREGNYDAALANVEAALDAVPMDRQMNQLKLTILAQTEDMAGLGNHLRDMVERFPENREVRTALVRWYLANDDADGAEAFVRELVANAGDEIAPRLALVQFLSQVRGSEAALAETERLIDEGLDNDTFGLLKASILFDSGSQDVAISQIESLVEGRESSETVRDMKTTLARMYLATGRGDDARALVDEVLEADPVNTNGLKLRANWLIEDDRVREAVLALRTALDQTPNDPETITLLARAYERDGNRELMAESLALAVTASNAAPEESLRYARFLIADEKYLSAEDVLLQSLRLSPSNLELLRSLSDVYLALNDLGRAEQVVQALRDLGTEDSDALANVVQAAIFQRSARTDESIELMMSMIREGQSALAAQTAIIRTRLANGEVREARSFMNDLLARTPEDDPNIVGVQFLNAALTATEGDLEAAQSIYRTILDKHPELEAVWRALIATTVRAGDTSGAINVVDEALAVVPQSMNLRWIKAGLAEQLGRIDEAIALYEELYEDDSNSTIIANNLASMITTYRDDEDSLERAYVIARRLRGSDFPAFQDTYGWIAYRLGNLDEALENLEPAAASLPGDPTVQYHLARLYDTLGRNDEALVRYDAALDLWSDRPIALAERAQRERDALVARVEAGETPETLPDGTLRPTATE